MKTRKGTEQSAAFAERRIDFLEAVLDALDDAEYKIDNVHATMLAHFVHISENSPVADSLKQIKVAQINLNRARDNLEDSLRTTKNQLAMCKE